MVLSGTPYGYGLLRTISTVSVSFTMTDQIVTQVPRQYLPTASNPAAGATSIGTDVARTSPACSAQGSVEPPHAQTTEMPRAAIAQRNAKVVGVSSVLIKDA